MAKKTQLRLTRAGTIINVTSTKQESDIYQALLEVIANIHSKYEVKLHHDPQWHLKYIVEIYGKIIRMMISAIILIPRVYGLMVAYYRCWIPKEKNILF